MGHLKAAVRDYEAAWEGARALAAEGRPLLGDAAAAQWLSYYQRELALYSFAHLDRRMAEFCLDRDLHPVMKGALQGLGFNRKAHARHYCLCPHLPSSSAALRGARIPAQMG